MAFHRIMALPAPLIEVHDAPELIKLKILENDHVVLVSSEPYDWGGVTYTFSHRKDYDAYIMLSAFVVWTRLARLRSEHDPFWVSDTGDPMELLFLYELVFDRLPNAMNESIGIRTPGKVGDHIGAIPQYYPEYYVPVDATMRVMTSSALIRPIYLITGGVANVGFAFIARCIDHVEAYWVNKGVNSLHERLVRASVMAKPITSCIDIMSLLRSVSIIGSEEPSSDGVPPFWREVLNARHQERVRALGAGTTPPSVVRWLEGLEDYIPESSCQDCPD